MTSRPRSRSRRPGTETQSLSMRLDTASKTREPFPGTFSHTVRSHRWTSLGHVKATARGPGHVTWGKTACCFGMSQSKHACASCPARCRSSVVNTTRPDRYLFFRVFDVSFGSLRQRRIWCSHWWAAIQGQGTKNHGVGPRLSGREIGGWAPCVRVPRLCGT